MSKPIFTWMPDIGANRKMKPNVHQTKFGDGYEVRVPIGINAKPKMWSVKFTRSLAEAEAIVNFLDARGAVESFQWEDPRGQTSVYVCRAWDSVRQSLGVYVVNANFEEVFEQ